MAKLNLTKIFESTNFKSYHPKAQKVLKMQLKSLDKKELIEDSDIMNIEILCQDTDSFYSLSDELSTLSKDSGKYKEMIMRQTVALSKQILAILNTLGGSTKSRRVLSRKDLLEAKENSLDELLEEDNE